MLTLSTLRHFHSLHSWDTRGVDRWKKFQSNIAGGTIRGDYKHLVQFLCQHFSGRGGCFLPPHHNVRRRQSSAVSGRMIVSMVSLGFSFYNIVYQLSDKSLHPKPTRHEPMWKQEVLRTKGLGRVYHRCLLKKTKTNKSLVMWLFASSEDSLKLLMQNKWDSFPSGLGSNNQA